MNLIRILALLLAVVALGMALVPMLVLIDLVTGGTGYGLCPGGIEGCSGPYTTGPELFIILALGLFGVVMAIRWLVRLARRLQTETSAPGGAFAGPPTTQIHREVGAQSPTDPDGSR